MIIITKNEKRVNEVKSTKNLIVSSLLFLFFIFDFLLIDGIFAKNWVTIITFVLVGSISFFSIVTNSRALSIYNMIHIFILLFFYYIGIRQYCSNTIVWNFMTVLSFNDYDYMYANIVIVIFQIIFDILYRLFNKKYSCRIENTESKFFISNFTAIVLTVISFALFIFMVGYYGFAGLIDKTEKIDNDLSQMESLIIDNFLRVFPLVILLMFINIKHNNNFIYKFCLLINFLVVFFVFFPIGAVSRYRVAFVYLSIMFSLLKGKIKNSSILLLFMIVAILVIFPVLNFFRSNSIYDLSQFKFAIFDYSSGDFDTYQMLISSIKYARSEGYFMGENILTAFLFFVPRSMWSGKMVGSGYYIAIHYESNFKNISCPLLGEFYLSFGIIGIILLAIGISYISFLFDTGIEKRNVFKTVVGIMIIGFVIFVMRGDLLSSYAYLMGSIFPFIIIILMNTISSKIKYRNLYQNYDYNNKIKIE